MNSPVHRQEQIETLAARWVCRRDSPDWNADDQAALDAWLAESTEHRVAWLRLQSVWRRADRLAALAPLPREDERVNAATVRPRAWRAIAASVAVAVIAGGLWYQSNQQHNTYTTGIGGRQTVPLADGSRLELNTRTKLRTRVGEAERTVWLEEGEAYFDIKRDPTRPFVVHVGDRRVTVLGTKFAVRRDKDQLEVAVVEGRVQVEQTGLVATRPAAIVSGGDVLLGKTSGTLVATHAAERVARDLSWRDGVLIFEQSTLADAAAEFNRYNEKQIVLLDEQTAQIRIGGNFDASAVDAFVRLLENGFGLRAQEQGNEILVSRR